MNPTLTAACMLAAAIALVGWWITSQVRAVRRYRAGGDR